MDSNIKAIQFFITLAVCKVTQCRFVNVRKLKYVKLHVSFITGEQVKEYIYMMDSPVDFDVRKIFKKCEQLSYLYRGFVSEEWRTNVPQILLNNTLQVLNSEFFLLLDWLPHQSWRAQCALIFNLQLVWWYDNMWW